MSDLKPSDLLDLDALLSDEERQIRDLAREWVRDRILPEVEDWYEQGEFPARELAKELGELGFFGMQLEGIGDLGAVAYGFVIPILDSREAGRGGRQAPNQPGGLRPLSPERPVPKAAPEGIPPPRPAGRPAPPGTGD